jgi:hypothetical protein
MTTPEGRSKEACPVCGAHELAVIGFPDIAASPYLPATDIFSGRVGGPAANDAPAIGCLACGAQWADLETFRAGAQAPGEVTGGAAGGAHGGG